MTDPRAVAATGLVNLDAGQFALLRALEGRFVGWAEDVAAPEISVPPLLAVADLARFDYFENFPHLGLAVSAMRAERLVEGQFGSASADLAPEVLHAAEFLLPSATCYGVYLSLRGADVASGVKVTAVCQCYRNEAAYRGLERLRSFRMREIVTVGTPEGAKEHLNYFEPKVIDFAAALGMPLELQIATDPFFDPNGSRAAMQRLFPVKREFVFGDGLAIGSLNYHRNYFGEKCGITAGAGETAHTACVAFGLERWLHALTVTFEGDVVAATEAVQSA